jgi:hypothetical protein
VWWIVGAILALLLLIGAGLFLGSRALYGSTFDQLVDAAEQAEGDAVWTSYFVAQDCFVQSVAAGDLPQAQADAVALSEQSRLLGGHVDESLQSFGQVPVRVFQPRLVAARDAIHAHYQVWDEFFGATVPLLERVEEDVTVLPEVLDPWWSATLAAQDQAGPVETTFNDAEAAFKEAASDDASRQRVDELFTASEARCTRGSV